MYVDFDYECIYPLDVLLSGSTCDYKKGESIQIMESTGPFMVTRVYERLKRKKSVTLLPADCVAPLTLWEVSMLRSGKGHPDVIRKIEKAFAIHYFLGTWTKQTAEGKQ